MKNGFRKALLISALTVAAGSASAGVITVEKGISFDASYTGNILTVLIDGSGALSGNLATATQFEKFEFELSDKKAKVADVSITQVNPGSDAGAWSDCAAAKGRYCFANSGTLALTSPITLKLALTGTDLDLSSFSIYGTFLRTSNPNQTTQTFRLAASEAPLIDAPAEVPEPASLALLGLGSLGLLGFARRKTKRA